MNDNSERRSLYPPIEANRSGHLEVGGGHRIWYEECGNPGGKPVVFLHGGPGGGCSPAMRRFWNPDVYRIILFDQRGAGKSTPHAGLEHNTTGDLVNDIELLREAMQVSRWQVFGGSWGSTLALAYAEAHPSRVSELILRGIFMMRRHEVDWFIQKGASDFFPDAWQGFLAPIPVAERGDLLKAYHRRLISEDREMRVRAARAWSGWEASTACLVPNPDLIAEFSDDDMALALARIECHYFVNDGFLEDNQLFDNVNRIRNIPGIIVHGRYDVLCPAVTAWELSEAWPAADLRIVPDAGHSAFEPGNIHELVSATDRFAG